MAWDARFQVVTFSTPLGHSRVTSCVTRADVTFWRAWRDAVPLNNGQLLVGPGIYRTLQYGISLFTSSLGYGKNYVQTNHMCDCPYCLHIDVVGTAYPGSHRMLPLGEYSQQSNNQKNYHILWMFQWPWRCAGTIPHTLLDRGESRLQ
jgi:hypothetical protein